MARFILRSASKMRVSKDGRKPDIHLTPLPKAGQMLR